VYDVVVKKFTFAISSRDEFLVDVRRQTTDRRTCGRAIADVDVR